jgi:hypothetical protein
MLAASGFNDEGCVFLLREFDFLLVASGASISLFYGNLNNG